MLLSVFVTGFGTIAALTLSGPAAPATPAPAPPAHHRAAVPDRPVAVRVGDLYSLRARRRIATYLRLRLLELREERLDRAADVIRRRLSPDVLLRD